MPDTFHMLIVDDAQAQWINRQIELAVHELDNVQDGIEDANTRASLARLYTALDGGLDERDSNQTWLAERFLYHAIQGMRELSAADMLVLLNPDNAPWPTFEMLQQRVASAALAKAAVETREER